MCRRLIACTLYFMIFAPVSLSLLFCKNITDTHLKLFQVVRIRMGQRLAEISEEGGGPFIVRSFFQHGFVALFYGSRHFPLAHVGSKERIVIRKLCAYIFKNPGKVGIASSKARGSEKKDLFMMDSLKEYGHFFITATFIGPEACQQIRGFLPAGSLSCLHQFIKAAGINTVLRRKRCQDGLCQLCGVACAAAEYNGIFHDSFLSAGAVSHMLLYGIVMR